MVKTSTIMIGIAALAMAGVGTFAILALLAPKQSTNETAGTANTSNSQEATPPAEDESATNALEVARQDTEVKNTLSRITAGLYSYSSNNRGALVQTESQLESFVATYLADTNLTNPVDNTPYQISLTAGEDVIYYQPGYVCSEDKTAAVPGTARQFALTVTLPSGASYCEGS